MLVSMQSYTREVLVQMRYLPFWVMPCVAVFLCGPTVAADPYAAFAVVPGKGAAFHGYATGASRSKAKRAALSNCRNRRCRVVQEYRSGQCAHVVLGRFQVFWNETGFTRSRGRDIMAHCRRYDENCKVVVKECLP